ncbi:putative MFS family arabinose efflux permease [Micromonospora pisi]|uniref:Putative MFS family arabinose efflux permease n=1 Tax=Micromonospora pisi TaxID=589240 RepID=A0A495JWV1_9ACTN|nr:MFS transporter [Micromonospora pisi]RKR93035.1 putative MFS family arabinose efflux permease [Micromonospora pisi]
MPRAETVATDTRPGGHRTVFHGWRIVAAFAVTQTVGYGTLYYAFAVLLQPMATTLHTSTTAVTGAFTASILAGAVVAVPVGRWLDRHGGRALMTTGSLVATTLVVAWSQVRTVAQLYAVLIGIGLTAAMVLYEPAFAVIISWFDPDRRAKALLAVTVVAGFASSIFLPLTGQLVDRYGWRTALLILAVVHGVVTVPLHAFIVRRPPRGPSAAPHTVSAVRGAAVRAALTDSRFWCLAVAFVAHSAAMSAMTVHLVGFLVREGHRATFAATFAGLLGALSVTGRLLLTGAQRRVRITTMVAAIFGIQAVAALCLPGIADSAPGAVAGVTAFGLGFGIASLAAPALLTERYGTAAYATIAGTLATPVTLAKAGAPLGAAALLSANGGYSAVLAAISGTCLVAVAGILTGTTKPAPVPALAADLHGRTSSTPGNAE